MPKVKKGSKVKLLTDLDGPIGVVITKAAHVVQVKWPKRGIKSHNIRFLQLVEVPVTRKVRKKRSKVK